MPPKPKPTPIDEILNESEAVQQEYTEIQTRMQAERIKNLRQWNIQRKLITETLKYFDQLRRNDARVKARLKQQENWEVNFKCDGLPHTFRPDDVRNFIIRWDHDIQSELNSELDWSLQRDELSILTQDETIPDTTLVNLKGNRIERGHKLVQTIIDVEYILNGIHKILQVEGETVANEEIQSLRYLRFKLHQNFKKCIDVYTLKLLRNMEVEMEPARIFERKEKDISQRKSVQWNDATPEIMEKLDMTVMHHSFNTKDFSYHIRALRDVPQPPRTYADRFTIPLASFGGEASLPYTMNMKDLAFRSYWIPFDYYSIYCPTYNLTDRPEPMEDLLTVLSQEWTELEKIDREKHAYLGSEKMKFDNTIQAWATEEQEKLEVRKTNQRTRANIPKKRQKRIKIKRQKLSFGDFNKYDSKIEYINNEDRKYEMHLKNMYPDEKKLIGGEINLRSHEILGGVFHFEFQQKPAMQANYFFKQLVNVASIPPTITNFQTIKLYEAKPSTNASKVSTPTLDYSTAGPSRSTFPFSRENVPETRRNSHIGTRKDTEHITPPKSSKVSLKDALRRSESTFDRPTQEFHEKLQSQYTMANDNLVMIEFEIKLPPNIMWWTKPTVCYWEPWEYSDAFQKLSESDKEFYRNYDEYIEKLRELIFKPIAHQRPSEKIIPDFDMTKIPKSLDFNEICREYIVPVLPYNYQTHMDIILDKKVEEDALRKRRIETGLQESNYEVAKRLSTFKHEIYRTPPSPLFVPQDQKCPRINIIVPSASDVELESIMRSEETTPYNLNSTDDHDEFCPPNILFSEFFRQVTAQARKEALLTTENASDIKLRMQATSDEVNLNEESLSVDKGLTRRSSKHTVSRGESVTSKDKIDQVQTFVGPQQLSSRENPESKGSRMPQYIQHRSGRWCNRKIISQRYDEEAQTITFRSPCFGAYGLAVDKYQHMPYKSWSLSAAYMKHPHVIMHLTTQFISLQIEIFAQGYSLRIPTKSQIPIDPGLSPMSLFEFKQLLSKVGLNIFPECDAPCYIRSITEKHPSMEHHIYNTVASFCRFFHFQQSPWNRFAHRRQVVIDVQQQNQPETGMMKQKSFTVLITPNESFRTKVREACSTDLNEIKLEYEHDPPEQEYQPDFFNLLKAEAMESDIKEIDEQMLCLVYNIAQLLWSIRPLSFS